MHFVVNRMINIKTQFEAKTQFVAVHQADKVNQALAISSTGLTWDVAAALGRDHPGLSVADWVWGETPVGGLVLLSDLSVSLSTESTGLSLHPVGHLDLWTEWSTVKKPPLCHIAEENSELHSIFLPTFNVLASKYTSWRPWLGAWRAMPSPSFLIWILSAIITGITVISTI